MSDLQGETVISLPADKKFFTVGEIPGLLAAAKWPHKVGRLVSYVTVLPDGARRTRMPETDEQEMLTAIWVAQKLPPPEFPLSESAWRQYVDAFDKSTERPAWSINPCWKSAAMDQGILRAAAEDQFREHLRDAIARGEITVRNPVTHMAMTGPEAQWGNEGLLISRDDFSRFARDAMMDVQDGRAEPEAPAAMSSMDTDTSPATATPRPLAQSRNAIGREIQEAIARIENGGTCAFVDCHSVMKELIARAGATGSCITEVAEGGLAVIWRDTAGKQQKLSKGALKKRLQRRP